MTAKDCLETWARVECAGVRAPVMPARQAGIHDHLHFEMVLHVYVQSFIFNADRKDGAFVARAIYGMPARWDQRPMKSKLQSLMELGHGEMVLTKSSVIQNQIVKDFYRCFVKWTEKNPMPEYIEPRSEDYIPSESEARNWS